jgi:hypothetical protein
LPRFRRTFLRCESGGTSWQTADAGLPRFAVVTALAIDPVHPTTLYVAMRAHGVFESTDSGQSWHSLNAGLSVLDVRTLALDATGRTLYAGTSGAGVVTLHLKTSRSRQTTHVAPTGSSSRPGGAQAGLSRASAGSREPS